MLRRALEFLNRRQLDPGLTDPGFRRADRVQERGDAVIGTVVGVEQRLEESTTVRAIAVRTGATVAGIRVSGEMAALARLHLGAEVELRQDGSKMVLASPEFVQKLARKPPAEGVTDKTAKRRTPTARATIQSVTRRTSSFGPTLDFDVVMRLPDGTTATMKSEIPFYAAWLAAPGAEVPVALDRGRVFVDWPAAAAEPGRTPARPTDPPPAGSAAAAY
jgi:hypothetical protein